jgi:transposase
MADILSVGIDVSKDSLDLGWNSSQPIERFENSSDGRRKLGRRLQKVGAKYIILEATGGYERPAFVYLQSLGLPAMRVNPRQVRHFAKAMGLLAKTDALDARVLAHFGARMQPEFRPAPEPQVLKLQCFVTRRRQLVEMRTAEKNRLEQATEAFIKQTIQSMIDSINELIDALDVETADLVKEHARLERTFEILTSVPGIANVTAGVLVAGMPELGQVSRQAIASLAGLAPYNNDSGQSTGKRSIRGGRSEVRAVLYMATLAAARCNPVIKEYVDNLRKGGKPPKVALTAGMRKLLTIVNALVRDDCLWGQKLSPNQTSTP